MCVCFPTHQDEPGDQSRVPDVPEAAVVDVRLHLQVEEETLVDDVGNPATKTKQCVSDGFHSLRIMNYVLEQPLDTMAAWFDPERSSFVRLVRVTLLPEPNRNRTRVRY